MIPSHSTRSLIPPVVPETAQGSHCPQSSAKKSPDPFSPTLRGNGNLHRAL